MKATIAQIVIAILSFFGITFSTHAQEYESDYLIGNYIRATKVDADGQKWKVKIPNGTKLIVDKRIIKGDSASSRSIMAEFDYKGETHTTEARWLKFSEDNPEGTVDLFADDDFSPTDNFIKDHLEFTHMNPLSAKGRFMYGLTLPVLMFVLMLTAFILILKASRKWSVVPFLLAAAIQVYYSLMLGNDALWWCLPEYNGIGGAILGFIPLALFLSLEFAYMVYIWAFSRHGIKLWPVILAAVFQFYAGMLGVLLVGNFLIGMLAIYIIPIVINGAGGGWQSIKETLLLIAGALGVLATLSAAFFAGWQILAAIVTVCPPLAWFISLMVKDRVGTFHSITKTSDGFYHCNGRTFATESEAKDFLKSLLR